MTIYAHCVIFREMEGKVNRKLIARVQVTDLATPEEKAGIVATLRRAGLIVFQSGNDLYIRVEADEDSRTDTN